MKKIKIVLVIICLFTAASIILITIRIEKHFPEVASRYCDQVIVREISRLINNRILHTYEDYNKDDVLIIEKDQNGNIALIDINTEYVNLIKSRLTLDIIEKLTEYKYLDFGIPLGNALNSYAFSGLGPEIPIRATPVGNVVSKTKSSLVSGGVNQTKYELYIEFIACVEISGPLFTETREIKTELCIAQTVIIGKVPGIVWGSDD
ncbi:MAG: sporulation protein YunB [Ruminococcaceae bacterium]|nr:sporulation protein YunB [Oscillospiraceae bacterium]MBQ3598463.1 sporulation protein YunB [Clostridia bacterium]